MVLVKTVDVAIIGAGNRGADVYAAYALDSPAEMRVVAVADPDRGRRGRLAALHGIEKARCYSSWEELLGARKFCDAVLICTGDRTHFVPAMAAIQHGYHVLLEKPMALSEQECLTLAETADQSDVIVCIAHVLRYTPFFQAIQSLLQSEAIGKLVSIQHNENVGYYHFAHSFVRGNWRLSSTSSPMILAKSCHDLDLLHWFAGARCRLISSFGSLSHFRSDQGPSGHTARCLDGCPHLHSCPFSAPRIYRSCGEGEWPRSVVSESDGDEALTEALRIGPYGRCVYECDNDVVDHQVTVLEFENGITAAFSLSAFTHDISRTMKFMGTRGEIRAHLERNEIELYDFSDGTKKSITPDVLPGKHAGGDRSFLRSFLAEIRGDTESHYPLVPVSESAESHVMAFAAERSRDQRVVVEIDRPKGALLNNP